MAASCSSVTLSETCARSQKWTIPCAWLSAVSLLAAMTPGIRWTSAVSRSALACRSGTPPAHATSVVSATGIRVAARHRRPNKAATQTACIALYVGIMESAEKTRAELREEWRRISVAVLCTVSSWVAALGLAMSCCCELADRAVGL